MIIPREEDIVPYLQMPIQMVPAFEAIANQLVHC